METAKVIYEYGMRLRGFAPLCQPREGLLERIDDYTGRYHDILRYGRELSNEELADYELEYIRKISKSPIFTDSRMREYIFDHGWKLDEETGMIQISKSQCRQAPGMERSMRYPKLRCLTIPSIHGLTAVFEKIHFEIV